MAKIKIEIDDKASKPLSKIDKEAKNVDDSLEDVEEQAKSTSTSFTKMAVAAAAVAAALGTAVKSSLDADRAMFGLDKSTREYIRSASELYGINETLIGQYARTFTSAGLASDQIASMMDSAVALGRLYPNEQTEEFVDNLRQFVTTGEDAGFVTDVLESHFKTTKLETIAFADKMKALKEITKDVNEEFAKTKAGRLDIAINNLTLAFTDLGTALWDFADSSGILWLVIKAMQTAEVAARGVATALYGFGIAAQWALGNDTTDMVNAMVESFGKLEKAAANLFGAEGDITIPDINVTSTTGGGLGGLVESTDKAMTDMVELGERYISDFEVFSDGIWQTIEHGATSSFRNMLDGAKNWQEMMGDILKDILAQFFQIYVVKQLIAGVSGIGIDSIIGQFAKGGAFVNGVQKFASGGVVTQPTLFPMANGAGLMGEAGAEAIMPLTRMSNGNLGVEAEGAATVVNVNNYGNDNVSVAQDGNNIDIVISQIAQGIQRGTNGIGDAIESRYGIRKQ